MPMRLPSIKTIAKIELGLLVTAIVLYLLTMNANDLSGLVILYPIFAMFIVGVLAVPVLIVGDNRSEQLANGGLLPVRPTPVRHILLFLLLMVPIFMVISGSMRSFYSVIVLAFCACYVAYSLMQHRLGSGAKKTSQLILISFLPGFATLYAFDPDNTTPIFFLVCAVAVFYLGVIRIVRSR